MSNRTERVEFYYPSTDGVTRIHAVAWLPEHEPVGVLQIAHGITEYALRYEPFARFMNGKGFVVAANDHLGHGHSVAPDAAMYWFGEQDGWFHVVDDMETLRRRSERRYRGLPCFLLGHSMGSFLARTYLIRYPGAVRGAILMGTAQQSRAMLAGGLALAELIGRKEGFRHSSERVNRIAFGAYNRPFAPNRTQHDWLSANPENVDDYIADPHCGGLATIGLFRDMLGGMAFNSQAKNLAKMDKATPVLFVSGAEDPVGDMGKGVLRAYESFLAAGVRDVTLKLYPGMRHEILNEADKHRVYADLWAWISRYLPAGETGEA